MKKFKKVLISGAGIAGMAAAIRLSKKGFECVIVEKAPEFRPGGYLVALSHQSYIYAEEMDLIPDLKPYDLKIRSSSYYDRKGHSLLDLDYSKMMLGLDIIQLMRDDLAKVLYEHAKDLADIRFDETISKIEEKDDSAHVTFTSGTTEDFDVIIGADGVHSGVRNLTFNESEYDTYYLDLHCAAFRLPNILDIEDKFATHMERERYMAVFNTDESDIGAVFVWASKERSLPAYEDRKDYLIKSFENSTDAIHKVLKHCPTKGPSYMDVLKQLDMPTWHKGRSMLVGDAAHCLTLFSGRGAAAAFAGACRLSDALIESDNVEEAFQRYEKEMRPIIDDIMPATRGAVRWYVPMSMVNYLLRDNLMRFVPNAIFRKYFQMKYSNV